MKNEEIQSELRNLKFNQPLDQSMIDFIKSSTLVDINENKNLYMGERILPVTLSLTLDGISGMYPGYVFKIDYLPKRYIDNNTIFRIKCVSHSITDSDWTTTIEANMMIGEM